MAKDKHSSTKGLERQLQEQKRRFKPEIENTRPNGTNKTTTPRDLHDRDGFPDDYGQLGRVDLQLQTQRREFQDPLRDAKKKWSQ